MNEELNPTVLRQIETYPADGTHDYFWPKGIPSTEYHGTTCDVSYKDIIIAKGDPERRAYCCGLTFEVFLRSCELFAQGEGKSAYELNGVDVKEIRRIMGDWFVARGGRGGPVDALVPRGLGRQIIGFDEAQRGDFMQLWRVNGSGHSVVFLEWVKEAEQTVGIRYWSTQPATKGIGIRVERFADKSDRGLVRDDEIYIARAFVPTVI